jgi:uroporphyrinogen-III decarboxylase
MTSRERMRAACYGEDHDRIPWCPEINAFFVDKHLTEAGKDPSKMRLPYVEANKLIGADALLGFTPYEQYYEDGIDDRTEETATDVVRTITTPVGTLESRTRKCPDAHTNFMYEPLIKTVADYKTFQYLIERTRLKPKYDELEETEKALGEDGIISLSGPATPLMDLIMVYMHVENTLIQMLEHEKEFDELCAVIHDFYKKVYKVVANAPTAVMVRPFEDTSMSLYSPATFMKHCFNQLKDYARIVHEGGKLFVPHMCGFLKQVLEHLPGTDLDGIEAVTPPPTGNTPIALAREKLGPEKILIGGLDPTEFSTCTTEDVRATVSETLESMKGDRRFMLSCEEISIRAKMESVLSVAELVKENGTLQ